MNKSFLFVLITVCLVTSTFAFDIAKNYAHSLTVEYRTSPVGIDTPKPRLSWKLPEGAVRQTAYQIRVATTLDLLTKNSPDVWDSGKVVSDRSLNLIYDGKSLVSSQKYWWKVKIWTEDGESNWSEPAFWTTALMKPTDWQAKWIAGGSLTNPEIDFGSAQWITAPPVTVPHTNELREVVFKKTFEWDGVLSDDSVATFTHIATCEKYEIFVGTNLFYTTRGQAHRGLFARSQELTPFLQKGENEILVRLWIPQTESNNGFIAKIELPNGERIVTDRTWQASVEVGSFKSVAWYPNVKAREELNSPAFEKSFQIKKPLKSALLHITGVGYYEAFLNGARIGTRVLDPSPSAFDKTVYYATFDVAGQLASGKNVLKVLLGHGWYDVRTAYTTNEDTASWREQRPRMIAQLELVYEDGSHERVVSDGRWRQVTNPVTFDCIREGEMQGGAHPRAVDLEKNVVQAEEVASPGGILCAAKDPGAKVIRTLKPVRLVEIAPKTWIVSFAENFAGWIRLFLRNQPKGNLVLVQYDERLAGAYGTGVRWYMMHSFYSAAYEYLPRVSGVHPQVDRIVTTGEAMQTYEPRFTYNGFQYVRLTGIEGELKLEDIEGCLVRTAFPVIGDFVSSDLTLNALMAAGQRSYEANFVNGFPTDCPHREKNGWTGDAAMISEFAQYGVENTAAYEKWIFDLIDAQNEVGDIPGIVPSGGAMFKWGNGPGWDSALSVIPWDLYRYRGDTRILDAVRPALKRYLAFTATKADADGLVSHGLWDWIAFDAKSVPTTEFTSSCFYYQAQRLYSEMCRLAGDVAEAECAQKGAEKTRAGIRAKFAKGNGVYANGGQTAQSMALNFGIVSAAERPLAEARLIEAVERTNHHLEFGLFGSKNVFRALSLAGRTDLAFKMLTNPTAPSMVEWLQKGSTTLWEDWWSGYSRNHIMFGDFMAWAYQFLAGIRLEESDGACAAIPLVKPSAIGFRRFVIAPQIIDDLDFVRAQVDGPYGIIRSSWQRNGNRVTFQVTIPPNCSALVRLPNLPQRELSAGNHTIEFQCDKKEINK